MVYFSQFPPYRHKLFFRCRRTGSPSLCHQLLAFLAQPWSPSISPSGPAEASLTATTAVILHSCDGGIWASVAGAVGPNEFLVVSSEPEAEGLGQWSLGDLSPWTLEGYSYIHYILPFSLGLQEMSSFQSDLSKGNYMKFLVSCKLRDSRLQFENYWSSYPAGFTFFCRANISVSILISEGTWT